MTIPRILRGSRGRLSRQYTAARLPLSILVPLSVLVLVSLVTLACFLLQRAPATVAAERQLTIGERFHDETSLTWGGAAADRGVEKPAMPPRFKDYPSAPFIELPEPAHTGLAVETALRQRRSVRAFSVKPITLTQLSELLFSAQGMTGGDEGTPLRPAPSAGALYPFEIYVVANRVEGLAQGIYHYSVRRHGLEQVKRGDFAGAISDAGLKQESLAGSAVTFVLSAVFDRTRSKYGERGFRYVYMEAGHISQSICLEAVSLGLGSVTVGAFLDAAVNELIGLDGQEEAAIYLQAVGAR
ncbi:MAG: SagB/ThcOx family dehydrogenase [Candidatus Eisenbacteria bacterium]